MKNVILILITLVLMWPCLAEKYFVIGEPEGDGEILYPTQVEEGPDGNIYIYDQRLAFIKVFSPGGDFLRKMGGKGQGPGEIQRSDDVYFNFTYDGKLLYFTEFFGGHRWITFMELSGKFHKVLKLNMKKNYGIIEAIHLKDGSFLANVAYLCRSGGKKDYYLYRCPTALAIISPQGEIRSEILKTDHVQRISSVSDGGDLGIPHVPLFQWVLLKNNSIIFSEGLSNVFEIYDMKGSSIGQIKTPVPEPQPVTAKDLEEWREGLKNRIRDKSWFNHFGKVIYKYTKSIYQHKPNIGGIALTPANNLLIQGLWNAEKKARSYWLMDLKGNTIKNLEIADPIYYLKISEHFIFAGSRDEDENPMVLCMKRQGTEEEDLVRLANYK